jgi:hypothetical protein
MLYRRNVGSKESLVRVLAGALVAGGALARFGVAPTGLALAGAGLAAALTGLVGWCPACALAGRRPADDGRR